LEISMTQPTVTEMQRINAVVWKAMGSDWKDETTSALLGLKRIFRKSGRRATDFEIVPVGLCTGSASSTEAAAMEDLQRAYEHMTNKYTEVRSELSALRAEKNCGFSNHLAQAEADAVRRQLEEVKATLRQTSAELHKAAGVKTKFEAEANAARRERDELRAALEKIKAELHEANQAKAEAEIGAAAVRRECAELRELLEQAKADVREAHGATGALHDTMAANGPTEAADAPTDTSADGVETEEDCSEAVSNEAATEKWYGWRRNLGSKAVDLHWFTVQAIDADLAAGRITKRQASGRKAAALRSYNTATKLGSRARTPTGTAA
jgi:archaellum component FlaC